MRAYLAIMLLTTSLWAGDLQYAFPKFSISDGTVVPSDFTLANLYYELDVPARKVKGVAEIEFNTEEFGFPAFDLVPSPFNITVDGAVTDSREVSPDNVTTFRILTRQLAAGSHHMRMEWSVGSATFGSDYVRLGFFMGDLSDRNFFEQYGPTSFEYDHYQANVNLDVKGTTTPHVVYSNGRTNSKGNSFQVEFPKHFTTSSFFLHVANRGSFPEKRFDLQLKEATIPVVIYGESVESASTTAKRVLNELESDYGPYVHESLTAYITSSGGGMEYSGATMTTTGALGHELTHSWFARGVMPANGNGAWIDEAVASWRDSGYPTYGSAPGKQALAAFSPYRRYTTNLAYSGGMRVIGHLDSQLGGMKGLLRTLFAEKKQEVITTEFFREFLERKSGKDLRSLFARSVYNQGRHNDTAPTPRFHPRKYTAHELRLLQ